MIVNFDHNLILLVDKINDCVRAIDVFTLVTTTFVGKCGQSTNQSKFGHRVNETQLLQPHRIDIHRDDMLIQTEKELAVLSFVTDNVTLQYTSTKKLQDAVYVPWSKWIVLVEEGSDGNNIFSKFKQVDGSAPGYTVIPELLNLPAFPNAAVNLVFASTTILFILEASPSGPEPRYLQCHFVIILHVENYFFVIYFALVYQFKIQYNC